MQYVLEIVNKACFITSVLLIWFRTDAFVSYCELFSLFKTTVNSYKLTVNLSFPQFLFVTYKDTVKSKINLFALKLITCPVCLNVWLSAALCYFTGDLLITPLIYILSLSLYNLLIRIML